jgi:hypothetical protein
LEARVTQPEHPLIRVQIHIEGDHPEVFPEACKDKLKSTGDFPYNGQKFSVEDVCNAKDVSFIQGQTESFLVAFCVGAVKDQVAHVVNEIHEFRLRHGFLKG